MVYGLIRTVQASLKYRGGWKGLLEHMYTVSPPIGGNAGLTNTTIGIFNSAKIYSVIFWIHERGSDIYITMNEGWGG